jgi:hypothetical protein
MAKVIFGNHTSVLIVRSSDRRSSPSSEQWRFGDLTPSFQIAFLRQVDPMHCWNH